MGGERGVRGELRGGAVKTARDGGDAKARGSKTGKVGGSACAGREGMGGPKPPAGGSGRRAAPPSVNPVGGLSLDDAALVLDEYGDRVALRRPVLELASKMKKAPADSSTAFKMAGETKSFPAPADHLIVSIGGGGGLHSENMRPGGWSGDTSPGFCDTVQNSGRRLQTNVFVRNQGRSRISDEVFYYTTNVQIQTRDLRPQGKDLDVDLGFGAAGDNNPVVLVIGDAFVPEIYDGPGSRVIILRVDGASFSALKDFVLKVFANKARANAAVLPPGSLVLVSANTEIRRLSAGHFWTFYCEFESWLYRFLAGGSGSRLAPDFSPSLQKPEDVGSSKITVAPLFSPSGSAELMDEITSVLYWSSVHRAAYPVPRPFGVLELASAVSGGTETSGELSVSSALAVPPPFTPNPVPLLRTPIIQSKKIPKLKKIDSQTLGRNQWFGLAMEFLRVRHADLGIPVFAETNAGQRVSLRKSLIGKPGPCLFKVEGRIVLAGMSNMAGISKHVIQHAGNARPVRFDKPLLTKEALDSLRGKLKKELGGQPGVVVLDLFANTCPRVGSGGSKSVFWTGERRGKVYHLADTKGGRLSQVSDGAVEDVLEGGRALVADLVSHGNLVITLAPLPRFEQPCCSNPQHGFADDSSVLVGCSRLNTRIRNLGLFMSKSRDFVMADGRGRAVVVTPAYVFRAGTADRPKLTGSDGVHLAPDDARHLAAFLLVLVSHLQSGNVTLPSQLPVNTSFLEWERHMIAQFPPVCAPSPKQT